MVLIVGGMAQGKLDFARRELGVKAWSDGELGAEDCVYGLQRVVRALAEPWESVWEWCGAHPDGVLICDEVGCGVTPLDREERVWREQVGRVCCQLAAACGSVYRVNCGLGVRIK